MKIEDLLKKEKLILYHGSRGGIDGQIKPISRLHCDFGCGFYMGTNPKQVKGLVIEDPSPIFYTLKLSLSKISPDKILVLDDMQWVYTVLANRNKLPQFNNLHIAKDAIFKCNQYDFVIGVIADDRMNEAMRRFSRNGLTDKGLLACLASVDYGLQIVAKSDEACKMIEILDSKNIYGKEADDIKNFVFQKRAESQNIVDDMARKYLRKGLYLEELIQQQEQTHQKNSTRRHRQ